MSEETIEYRVKRAIACQIGGDANEIVSTENLEDEYQIDSLDRVELVMELEDEFEIEIPDEPAETWKTPQDIIDYITARVA